MDFTDFAEKAVKQDRRNIFTKYDGNLDIVPDMLKSFYRDYNPVDVEINGEIGAVRFCPAEGLDDLQHEYAYIGAQFILATCNSDPIFYSDGKIYTCPHGIQDPKWEIIDVETLFLQEKAQFDR